jgi:flagellar hook-associated protein 2
MNVSEIANLYTRQQSLSTNSNVQSDPVQKAFATAASRIEKQQQTTNVQLSSYGKVKAAFASVDDAAKSLSAMKSTTSSADLKKGIESFVQAYNDARGAAVTTEGSARSAGNDLRRTASSDGNRSDLRSLGITQNTDGSLAIDSKKLDAALQANPEIARAAATQVSGQMQQVATRALSSSGSVGATFNTLTSRADSLNAAKASQANLTSAYQKTVSDQANRWSASLAGITSYQNIFSM